MDVGCKQVERNSRCIVQQGLPYGQLKAWCSCMCKCPRSEVQLASAWVHSALQKVRVPYKGGVSSTADTVKRTLICGRVRKALRLARSVGQAPVVRCRCIGQNLRQQASDLANVR